MPTSFDQTDKHIIDVLVSDSRLSASEVGRRVGLSPPAAKRRIDRLEGSGAIEAYTLVLGVAASEDGIEAFIELRFAPGTQVDDIDAAVGYIPQVVEAFTLAGDPDSLVRVRVANLKELKSVVDRIRRGLPDGPRVMETRTKIVLGHRRAS
jgi:Lrp/AsnC family leucine-responsive transcriptional regulator